VLEDAVDGGADVTFLIPGLQVGSVQPATPQADLKGVIGAVHDLSVHPGTPHADWKALVEGAGLNVRGLEVDDDPSGNQDLGSCCITSNSCLNSLATFLSLMILMVYGQARCI